jgi:chromosome segregation ATPase
MTTEQKRKNLEQDETKIAQLLEQRSQVIKKMQAKRAELETLNQEANSIKAEIETITQKYESNNRD